MSGPVDPTRVVASVGMGVSTLAGLACIGAFLWGPAPFVVLLLGFGLLAAALVIGFVSLAIRARRSRSTDL